MINPRKHYNQRASRFLPLFEKVMDDIMTATGEDTWTQLLFLDMATAVPDDFIPHSPSLRHFAADFFQEASRCIFARLSEEPMGEPDTRLPERVVAWIEGWASAFVGPNLVQLEAPYGDQSLLPGVEEEG